MSTVWRGLCLSHVPAIEFDLIVDGRELYSSDEAVAELRKGDGLHEHCDVVAGGFSYPLVSVACPHTSSRCVSAAFPARMWNVEVLRLAHQASRLPADTATEPLRAALTEWFRTNRCWTPERLARLLEADR